MARIALVHDWLTGMRGGEKVLEVLCERFPSASLFTLVHLPGSGQPGDRATAAADFVHPAAADGLRFYRQYLPLFSTAVEQFDLDGYDVIVSVSHCCVKSVVKPGARSTSVIA